MAYIGNSPANRFVASKAATQFSGDGSTTAFTLDHAVGSDEDILVSVDGVIQEPSVAYAVSNGTTLTFTLHHQVTQVITSLYIICLEQWVQ